VNPEMQELNKLSVGLAKVEVAQEQTAAAIVRMSGSIDRLVDRLEKSDDIAREAFEKVKSAQYQINEQKSRLDETNRHYDSEIRALNSRFETETEKRKQGNRWIIGMVFTAASFVVAVIKLF